MGSEVRNDAFKLRRLGWSYNEINKKLGIPKSTLSGWFSNLTLSNKALKRLDGRKNIGTALLIKRNIAQTHKAKKRVGLTRKIAEAEVSQIVLTKELLQIIGVSLYWGEGYKRPKYKNGRELSNHPIQLTNSDPVIARAFVRFLYEVMEVPLESIKMSLRLYDHINEQTALKYWLKATGLPPSSYKNVTRLVSVSSQRKKPYNSLPFGTVELRINDTERFHRLMGWLEGLKSQLTSSEVPKVLG